MCDRPLNIHDLIRYTLYSEVQLSGIKALFIHLEIHSKYESILLTKDLCRNIWNSASPRFP
ncbi:8151_t:CDS:2 [Diversispora eburnea]|uniref:8151_t:CDS:1 n=1 Tax=Diversispora eburnea TaxID=1213867 RepID=A0A9N8ZTN5_9GLOM|nr:8151_t:CDS:2 [Diversispora eburnea]